MPRPLSLLPLFALALALAACQDEPPAPAPTAPAAEAPAAAAPTAATPAAGEQAPPTPPLRETFDGEPQLSLFPRAGAFRPDESESQQLAYWATYIDHLVRTSGLLQDPDNSQNHYWSLRSIKSVDAIGFFSPLAVKPATTYRLKARIKGVLPEQASAGLGILEFNEFLWIGDQFTQNQMQQHLRGSQEALRVTGNFDWTSREALFTTGPETRMIHLVLFREGPDDRNSPVLFDDIEIAEADPH